MRRFSRGDHIIFQETKANNHSRPNLPVDTYVVDHYLTVKESRSRGTLVLVSAEGELHVMHNENPNLRRASLWQRLMHRSRFPKLARSN